VAVDITGPLGPRMWSAGQGMLRATPYPTTSNTTPSLSHFDEGNLPRSGPPVVLDIQADQSHTNKGRLTTNKGFLLNAAVRCP